MTQSTEKRLRVPPQVGRVEGGESCHLDGEGLPSAGALRACCRRSISVVA